MFKGLNLLESGEFLLFCIFAYHCVRVFKNVCIQSQDLVLTFITLFTNKLDWAFFFSTFILHLDP